MINPEIYTKEYYLTNLEGYSDFEKFKKTAGAHLNKRFSRLLCIVDVKPNEKILDIACGRGEMTISSAIKGAEAIGIDYSDSSISLCNVTLKSFPEEVKSLVRFEVRDCTKLPYEKESFDKIFMFDLVEHLFLKDLKETINSSYFLLKKNGTLYIHTMPNSLFYKFTYPLIRFFYPVIKRIFPSIKSLMSSKPNWDGEYLPKNPEEGQEFNLKVHVNILSPFDLKKYTNNAGFKSKIIMEPFTKQNKYLIVEIIYRICKLPLLKYILCAEIIVICNKK